MVTYTVLVVTSTKPEKIQGKWLLAFFLLVFVLSSCKNQGNNSVVTKGKFVSLKFVLRVANEEIVDSASGQDPFSFVQGIGMMLPQFEAALEGKHQGETFELTLFVDDAYGPYFPEYVFDFPITDFSDLPQGQLRLGEFLPMEDSLGGPLYGEIIELNDSLIKLDFNHPLAGMNLHYSGTILEVRPATPEEMDTLYWKSLNNN